MVVTPRPEWLPVLIVTTRRELPARQQRLLMMRFYGNMSQAQIGEALGISQMHVSRQLTRALAYLRERLLSPGELAGD